VRLPAQLVVVVSSNRSVNDLAGRLRGACAHVELVGDARSPRQLQQAMLDGHQAGASV
jgi:hypothetical protein